MKIVIINKDEGLKMAGVGVFTQRLKKFLTGRRWEVLEIRFSNKKTKEPNVVNIKYHLADRKTMILVPASDAVKKIKKTIHDFIPDIVYLNIGTSVLDMLIPGICHHMSIPIAAVWHGDFRNSSKLYEAFLKAPFVAYINFCQKVDLLHVFSGHMKKYLVSKAVPSRNICVVPNGVDTSKYVQGTSNFSEKYHFSKAVLFLGRITEVKNPELLIKAFIQINPSPDTKLLIVGYGELLKKLERKYSEYKQIIFTGVISNEEEKIEILNASNVFVLPSKFEGMSLSLLEAMSCGLACVVSDVGTSREMLNGAGKVIKYENLEEKLPGILKRLLDDDRLCRKIGKKARARAEKYYSLDKTFGMLEENLQKTINSHHA